MSATSRSKAATRERVESWAGKSVPRKEDGRLVQGEGSFIDDLGIHGQGYAWFVRSPYAHARIVSVDPSAAMALQGVYAVLTGAEAREMCLVPFVQIAPGDGGRIEEWPLAVDKVRYQGDAVAVVLADSRDTARDAAELVEVEYEPLAVVVDGVEAAEPTAPVLHEKAGTNVAWHGVYDYGDIDFALENADHVVKIDRLHFHRFSSTPLECNGAVVDWDKGSGVVDVKSNIQMPMFAAMVIGPALGVAINAIVDALAPLGVTHIDMPLTREKVWRAVRSAKGAAKT